MRGVSSAFFEAMQQNGLQMVELIQLTTRMGTYRWNSSNQTIVSSGSVWDPFPGMPVSGIEESNNLGISNIEFVVINSGTVLPALMQANEFEASNLLIRRVFTNSPDLGSIAIYRGLIGDYAYNRHQVTGQARNFWGSPNIQFPYYTYMDTCVWRFGSAGCGFDTTSVTVNSVPVNSMSNYRRVIVGAGFIDSRAPSYFDRGRLTVMTGANSGQVRSILTSSGNALDLMNRLPYSLSSGDVLSIYPGCRKRLVEDCASKYDNALRFFGFPWIPRQEQAF